MNQQADSLPVNSPLADLAKLYTALERCLRSAQNDHLTISEIYTTKEVRDAAKDLDQVKRIVRDLQRKDFVLGEGTTASRRYWWNPDAEPFHLGIKTAQKAATQPSAVITTKPLPQPVEVVFNGVMLTISRRDTGALRIQIDDLL